MNQRIIFEKNHHLAIKIFRRIEYFTSTINDIPSYHSTCCMIVQRSALDETTKILGSM